MLLSSLNKRFISKNNLDIVDKPDQYFTSYSLVAGTITYKGITYNIKKIQLEDNIKPNSFSEVQLIDLNAKSPYLAKYIDYIIEQEEHNGHWEDKAVYILMENSDYDLRTYVTKNGPLCLEDTLALCECLIGANYYFQKQLKRPHGDIRPQNVRVFLQKNRPIFKLSYFEDKYIPQAHRLCMGKDTLAYMAPELLCSPLLKAKYGLQESPIKPSQELQTLITECPNEIKYEPFRGDVFSAGMVIFSAATNIFFRLPLVDTIDAPRDGVKEIFAVNQNLKTLKNQHQCDGLVELLRIMMTHNPMVRYDFEELVLRMAKLNARDPRIPKIRPEESNKDRELEEEHRMLKGKFLELQAYTVRMRDREMEFQNIINQMREQLDNQGEDNEINTRKTLDIEEQPIEILNEISSIASILEENTSFLSPTYKKALESADSRDKKSDFSDTKTSSKTLESQVLKEPVLVKRHSSSGEGMDQQKAARHKNAKMNQGQLTHMEIKHSIIKRREISDLRIPS